MDERPDLLSRARRHMRTSRGRWGQGEKSRGRGGDRQKENSNTALQRASYDTYIMEEEDMAGREGGKPGRGATLGRTFG